MKKYNYDWELELHKFSKLDKVKKTFDMTVKEMVFTTLGVIAFFPLLYYGTIVFMAMIYAVSGVR